MDGPSTPAATQDRSSNSRNAMEPTGKNPRSVCVVGYVQSPGSGLLGISPAFRPPVCLPGEDSPAVFQERPASRGPCTFGAAQMAPIFRIKGTLINGANIYARGSVGENTAWCFFRVNSTHAKALGNKAARRLPRMVGSCESPFCNSTCPGGSFPAKGRGSIPSSQWRRRPPPGVGDEPHPPGRIASHASI